MHAIIRPLVFAIAALPLLAAGPQVQTGPSTPLGTTGVSLNGRIQPGGAPGEYRFEYRVDGGSWLATPRSELPPRLAAYYRETWDHGVRAGWRGGLQGMDLHHLTESGNGFVRCTEPTADDPNHDDGIGTIHLTAMLYPGTHPGRDTPAKAYRDGEMDAQAFLGGGLGDLRDAKVSVRVRGVDFRPNGSELAWWLQTDNDLANQLTPLWRRANWAHTGYFLTDALRSGEWQPLEYTLSNLTTAWSYGGRNAGRTDRTRMAYEYESIDRALASANCNVFHVLLFVDPANPPTGAIDYDEFQLTYRNRSLVLPSNGATLLEAPGGVDAASALTDGWRNGPKRTWSAPAQSPSTLVYRFARTIRIETVQLHNDPEWPSREAAVATSLDGRDWEELGTFVLADRSPHGPNFNFAIQRHFARPARFLKVEIRSGHRPGRWGLGEIEVFGSGARYGTDDAWQSVNADVRGIQPGSTLEYRLVAETAGGETWGETVRLEVPRSVVPVVVATEPRSVGVDRAVLAGRVAPMGLRTEYYFEIGRSEHSARPTSRRYAGFELSPRTVQVPVTGLDPGSPYVYRLVAVNEAGASTGPWQRLQTGK